MSLSNCNDCKFNGDHACAVNPDYRQAYRDLTGGLASEIRKRLEPLMVDCKDWEASQPITLSITLSQCDWMAIANRRVTSHNIVPQVREALNFVPPNNCDDIPF